MVETLEAQNLAAIAAEEERQKELAEFAALTPDEKAAKIEKDRLKIQADLDKRNALALKEEERIVAKLGVPPSENKAVKIGKGVEKPARKTVAKKGKKTAPKKATPKVKKSKRRGW